GAPSIWSLGRRGSRPRRAACIARSHSPPARIGRAEGRASPTIVPHFLLDSSGLTASCLPAGPAPFHGAPERAPTVLPRPPNPLPSDRPGDPQAPIPP